MSGAEKDEIIARKVCYNEGKSDNVSIFLCSPNKVRKRVDAGIEVEEVEECPITCEPIGSEAYTLPHCKSPARLCHTQHPNKKSKTEETSSYAGSGFFFSEFPVLSCAQMLCGHRFDVRALIYHFICNAMNCPLCRMGSNCTLSPKDSFPKEKWISDIEEGILLAAKHDAEQMRNEDEQLAVQLQRMDYFSLPTLIFNTLRNHSVEATLSFYNSSVNDSNNNHNNNDNNHHDMQPVQELHFQMELLPVELTHRDLSRGVSLYSSFSNASIATPPSSAPGIDINRQPSSIVTAEVPLIDLNNNNDNDNDYNTDSSNSEPLHHNNDTMSPNLILRLGNDLFSLNDISVRYAMSESTLR